VELFHHLFAGLLLFVYHCFDRIVINGYLSALTRPEKRTVPKLTSGLLSKTTLRATSSPVHISERSLNPGLWYRVHRYFPGSRRATAR
jgi:hypothetical protein